MMYPREGVSCGNVKKTEILQCIFVWCLVVINLSLCGCTMVYGRLEVFPWRLIPGVVADRGSICVRLETFIFGHG